MRGAVDTPVPPRGDQLTPPVIAAERYTPRPTLAKCLRPRGRPASRSELGQLASPATTINRQYDPAQQLLRILGTYRRHVRQDVASLDDVVLDHDRGAGRAVSSRGAAYFAPARTPVASTRARRATRPRALRGHVKDHGSDGGGRSSDHVRLSQPSVAPGKRSPSGDSNTGGSSSPSTPHVTIFGARGRAARRNHLI